MAMTAEKTIESQLRSAAKIEPDRLPRLKLIAADWADASMEQLNEIYASPVEIEFLGVSSLAFANAAADLQAAASVTIIRSPKWREIGFAVADTRLADTIVEAVFGGSGDAAVGPTRPMSKLDHRFVDLALSTMINAANPIFAPVAPLDMVDDRALHTAILPQLQDVLQKDNLAFVDFTFKISIGNHSSTLRFALPERALSVHRRKLTIVPESAPLMADEAWARDITEGLQLADLEIRALLDEKQITLGDVARFTLGQTIVLDATTDSLIIIECEEQRLFRGRMGSSHDSYVVRIEEKIDPTEEFIDDILSD
ncbi:flagellar motor switch protein FliM [Aureimonas sp. SA4125]|uniref:FliM/FliN family flagellar motor switch protein n=1 Tax=Aureimonas sp. SA4125 TaxID=2826993 RepID=UPI001CC808A3|nr:FliM/FliN family flagellar motor switch protein [Aureimonas sp. SA4125]BDA85951.1 flagellar motor switch protein FliM [Aureimonas sp. SA4125]